jgi:hypothetical protein
MTVNLWSAFRVVAIAALVLQGTAAYASPITIQDAYLSGTNNCASPACDVIGNQRDFDANKIVFSSLTPSSISAQVWVNYHRGDLSLSPWTEFGLNLQIGDLVFQNGSQSWAVPLHSHNGFAAGQLYKVSDFYTANEALGNPSGVIYRPNENVQIQAGTLVGVPGSVSTACATGSASGSQCLTSDQVVVSLTFAPDSAFWNALSSSGLNVHFAAATCGNDIVDGSINAVPEPATLLLLGGGLASLGFISRRKLARKTATA